MRLPPSNSHSQPQPLSCRTCGSTTIAKFFENAPIRWNSKKKISKFRTLSFEPGGQKLTCGCQLVIAIHSRNSLAVDLWFDHNRKIFRKWHQSAGIRKSHPINNRKFLSQEDKLTCGCHHPQPQPLRTCGSTTIAKFFENGTNRLEFEKKISKFRTLSFEPGG